MKKLWSDSVHYYSISKTLQNTFRISIQMSGKIDCGIMREAIETTQKRYPYFSIKRVKTFRDTLLDDNMLPWVLNEGVYPLPIGGKESNYHMLAFGYHEDWLYIDAFHGMTDGIGIFNLIRTLLYYYCSKAYDPSIDPGNIRLVGDVIPPEEINDPYRSLPPREKKRKENLPKQDKPRYMNLMKEHSFDRTRPYTFWLEIQQNELMQYCGENDGSPATAIALFMARTLHKMYPDSKDLIGCGIATDLRLTLGVMMSHYSTVEMPVLDFTSKIAAMPFEIQGTAFRGQVIAKCDPERFVDVIYSSNSFFAFLDKLHIRKLKESIMRILVKLALSGSTFSISYAGRSSLGECEKYVKQIYSEPDAPGTGIMIELNSVNDIFCLSFMQEWQERAYFDAFCDELKSNGISFRIKDEHPIRFSNILM